MSGVNAEAPKVKTDLVSVKSKHDNLATKVEERG